MIERVNMTISYEKALQITKDSSSFYVNYTQVNGHQVAMFNYMLAGYADFVAYDAFELRGLTYIQNADGSWGDAQLHLHKFFNLNQSADYMLSDVQNKDLIAVYDKLDGSMIRFVSVGGQVFAKTKMSFVSEQAVAAQSIYDTNDKVRAFVDFALENNLAPIFEYVSPYNRIVVGYDFSDLVLLSVRDNLTGSYLDVNSFASEWDLKVAETMDISFDDVLSSIDSRDDIEGFVLHFSDGQMMKVKTSWYLKNHRLLTQDVAATHFLVGCVLDDTIDDVLSAVPLDQKNVREYIMDVSHKVSQFVNDKVTRVLSIIDLFDGDRKSFALKYKSDEDFHLIMKSLNNPSRDGVISVVKDFVSRNTNALEKANQFLGEL